MSYRDRGDYGGDRDRRGGGGYGDRGGSRGGYEDRGGQARRISLLVRNLPLEATADDVRQMFERYGEIRDVYLPRDYYTQRPKGFGFIEFRDNRDADEALYKLDRSMYGGREISVVMSKESRKTPRDMIKREEDPRGGRPRDTRRSSYRSRSRSPSRGRGRGGRSRSRSRSRGRSASRSPRRDRSRSASPRRDDNGDKERGRSVSPRKDRERSASPRKEVDRSASPRREDRSPSRSG